MRMAMVLGTVLALVAAAYADGDAEDSLRFLLAKSDLVVLGEIASPLNVFSEEAGVVHYSCAFRISEVLKGQKPADDTIRVVINRLEREEADRLPELKQGSKCIVFLKQAADGERAPWETADAWFGVQRPSPAMARSLKQLARQEKEAPRRR